MSSQWYLEEFKVEFPRWRDTSQPSPPGDRVVRVDRWWRGLEFSSTRPSANRVSPDRDPDGNLWWTWVPDVGWIDDQKCSFRVLCYLRVFENEDPRRIVCERFETLPTTSP